MVTVVIPTPFRKFSDGRDRVEVEGATLRQVFDNLGKVYPELKQQVVSGDGLRPGLAVAINDLYTDEGLLEKVPDGCTIHILPALSGG
jgi:molybdopterin converting factor small subunit